ncbi:unnamed protein product [Nezara viridula]|uniref:Bromo domain-containing protein n=1 Tax=Nezara viridula TaxID=85310 RepID=A0A9P0E984_NEZVI|nr:unnamed protein product [Nezara viridula]
MKRSFTNYCLYNKDIQSWWEVPSIAHFCSLFRVAFNLLDFDIEELEEALLTDGTEFNGNSLLQDLIVRLLCGCLGHNGISTFNYQMFLRRLFRTKCKEQGRENPFNTDIDFQFLPLRTKVEILHALCDFRLDADDVIDVLKNLDSDSLRVHPLGHDENRSAYWYFYGTRLYKEEYPKKRKKKKDHDKSKKKRKEGYSSSSEDEYERRPTGTWRVMCYTEADWRELARSMAGSSCREERALYTVLSEDFLPEIPRLFEEKERLQRKRAAEQAPRRASRRLAKQEEQTVKPSKDDRYSERERVNREKMEQRERQARIMNRSQSDSDEGSSLSESALVPAVGRQTNNSLSSATGEIFIQPNRQKFKTTQLRTREDLMTGMYKILDRVKAHKDAWPFLDPVDEDYAPKYYSVIAKPMDLQTMEDKLDNGEYGSLQQFKADFQLIVDNCRQYNGSDNEYTEMVRRLQEAFEASAERYLDADHSSSDDDMPPMIRHNVVMTSDSSSSQLDRPLSRSSSHESSLDNDSDPKDSLIKRDLKEQSILNRDNKVDKSRFRRKQKRKKKSSKVSSIEEDDSSEEEFADKKRISRSQDVSSDGFDVKTSSSRDSSKDRSKNISKSIKNRSRNRFRVKRKGVQKKEIDKDKRSTDGSSSEISKSCPVDSSRETSKERSRDRVRVNYKERETSESEIFTDSSDDSQFDNKLKTKTSPKKPVKRAGIIKNVEAIEALELATEQTLKDINKWLDDTPRFSDFSSCSNSPLHMPYIEDMASIEGEYRRRLMMDRPMRPRDRFSNDLHRRRMFKEQMGLKRRREIQRTIDRLQPGKSKGNLLSKENHLNHHIDGSGIETKSQSNENDENAPKISLGKVLPSDLLSFGIGESAKKDSEDECTEDKLVIEEHTENKEEKPKVETEDDVKNSPPNETEKKVTADNEQKKEKPTPNLSAWFKAFGAPKAQPTTKKKAEPEEKKDDEAEEDKRTIEIQSPARRQRKASTGSSVSERSSFSIEPVDGNSPRRSLDEPYVSPQQDLKTYHHPPINGTIKVGFYQDTCFPRGSSDKSSSPRDPTGCSPRDVPSVSPRNPAFSPREYQNVSPQTPFCSPCNPPLSPSPREFIGSPRDIPPNASPRDYHNSPRELITHSREYSSMSPRNTNSPKDHTSITSYPVPHSSHNTPIYSHYPSHLSYYDTNKPIEYRTSEKNMSVYPVKKRAYNEIDNNISKANDVSVYKGGGSFTPTRGAMEQERTFTPTPGRMPGPSQGLRVPDPTMPMGLAHPLHYDPYADERRIASPFYAGNQPSSPHPIFSQSSTVLSANFRREPTSVQEGYDRQNDCELPAYHSSRSNTPTYPGSPHSDPQRTKTPISTFPNRSATPVHHQSPDASPINYSNANTDGSNKEISSSPRILNCSDNVNKSTSPYNKSDNSGSKTNPASPISFASSRLGEVLPSKVTNAYNRALSDLPHGLNYNHGQDLSKISVPLSYSNQSDLLSSKMNYNHPMADLIQSSARYNYPMSELIQGKTSVYNHPIQDFMQGKAASYPNMNLSGYNRPISELMQSKVNDLQAREMVFSPRSVPAAQKSESSTKPGKKSRKKKNDTSSGFQQYVAGSSEPIALKSNNSVPGSAFNFGPPLKDSYGPFLDEIRSSFFVSHPEGGSGKGTPHTSPYYLSHASARTPPTYPHPFMNAQYQQYLQRHPEELLRPMMLHQGLLPPTAGYPHAYLGMHDSINRPAWL